MAYEPGPRHRVIKKYAWAPIKTNSNKRIWFNDYYVIQTFYDENGKPPVKTLFWKFILNKNEYLIWSIKNPRKDVLPKAKAPIRYYAGY